MTLTAGSLDVTALLATAKEPLTMIDAAMQDATEAQAQDVAKANTEIATARALVLVAGECARWYKSYTEETKRSSDFIGAIADVLDPVVPAQLDAPNRLAAAATVLVQRVKELTDLEAAARQAAADAAADLGDLRSRAEARQRELEAEIARLTKLVPAPAPPDRRSIQLH